MHERDDTRLEPTIRAKGCDILIVEDDLLAAASLAAGLGEAGSPASASQRPNLAPARSAHTYGPFRNASTPGPCKRFTATNKRRCSNACAG